MSEQPKVDNPPNPPSPARELDFLIIGQGICGTFLSYYLLQAGKKILVIDEDKPFTASKAASGVINPVTGRRIVRTWRIEELLPFAGSAYNMLGNELGANLLRKCSVLDFHASPQMKEAFEKRMKEEPEYLHIPDKLFLQNYFNYHFGVAEISPCLLIDTHSMLGLWRKKLSSQNSLLQEVFSWNDCVVYPHHIEYKNIAAKKILCCDGIAGANNPYFRNLPFALNKGEAVLARIPNLPKENIYKQGLSIVPWKEDLFWIGSSYEWNFSDEFPTQAFKEKVNKQLRYWLKIPFEIVDHFAAVRPANLERRPFVGLHPKFPSVGILNGMGTKGCSLAPFFARQFADFLVDGKPIYPDADVRRLERILERKMN